MRSLHYGIFVYKHEERRIPEEINSGRTVRFLSEIYLFSVNYPSPKGNGLVTAQPS
jgi:hypothetical protein